MGRCVTGEKSRCKSRALFGKLQQKCCALTECSKNYSSKNMGFVWVSAGCPAEKNAKSERETAEIPGKKRKS